MSETACDKCGKNPAFVLLCRPCVEAESDDLAKWKEQCVTNLQLAGEATQELRGARIALATLTQERDELKAQALEREKRDAEHLHICGDPDYDNGMVRNEGDRLRELAKQAQCSYCGEAFPKDESGSILRHVETCPQRKDVYERELRAAEARIATIERETLERAAKAVDKRRASQEQLGQSNGMSHHFHSVGCLQGAAMDIRALAQEGSSDDE